MAIATCRCLAGHWLPTGSGELLVLFAGIFDTFDRGMVRVHNAATTFGAFFDAMLDRYAGSIIQFGLSIYALQHPGLQIHFGLLRMSKPGWRFSCT